MKNITLAIEENILLAGREYAKRHHLTLNALVRRLLEQTVTKSSTQWLEECFKLADASPANSGGKKWKRADLYRV
jgi:hypothetical protein